MSLQNRNFRRQAGLSLIELMITLVLSVLVTLGLITLMGNVGITNRVQDGMARMQENGRYALQRISQDVRAASSQYCSNFAAASSRISGTGAIAPVSYLDQGRPTIVHYDAGTALSFGPVTSSAPPAPPAAGGSLNSTYLISPRWMLFGSDCDASTCTPAVNAANRAIDPVVFSSTRAAMGVNAGNRVRGSDTLTMRYLVGSGVPVTAIRNNLAEGVPLPVQIDASPTALGITGAGQVWITDCSVAEVLRVNAAGGTLTANGNYNNDTMNAVDLERDPRAFNLQRDLMRVSYFLQVKDDPDPQRVPAARKILALMRAENGVLQEIVEGVERLDFLYAVDDQYGRTQYLTAAQVDALAADCPTSPAQPSGYTPNYYGTPEPGCGWRSVKSIEVSMLMNTVTDAAVTNQETFRYSWLNTGAANAANAFEDPSALGTMRSGLPPYRMLRREFRTQVALRGYNY